jgi:hypothetical protein
MITEESSSVISTESKVTDSQTLLSRTSQRDVEILVHHLDDGLGAGRGMSLSCQEQKRKKKNEINVYQSTLPAV